MESTMKRINGKPGRPMKKRSGIGGTGKRMRPSPRQSVPDGAVADQILIDHRPLDLFVVAPTGLPIGRPFVTYALDSSTGKVIDVSLSFEPPRGD